MPPPVAPRAKTPPKVPPPVAPRAKTPPKAAPAADAAPDGETFDFRTLLTAAALAGRVEVLKAEEAARNASAARAQEAPGDVDGAKKQLTPPEAPKTPQDTPKPTVSPKMRALLNKFVAGGSSDEAWAFWDKSTPGTDWEKLLLCVQEGCSSLTTTLASGCVPKRTLEIFVKFVDTDSQPPDADTARLAMAAALSELTKTFDELKRMLTVQGDVPAAVTTRVVAVCSEVDSQYAATVSFTNAIVNDTVVQYRIHARIAAGLAVLKDVPTVSTVLELLDPTAPDRKARQEMVAAGGDFSQQPRAGDPREFAGLIQTKCGEQEHAIGTLLGLLREAHQGEGAYVNDLMDDLERAQEALGDVHYGAETTASEAWATHP